MLKLLSERLVMPGAEGRTGKALQRVMEMAAMQNPRDNVEVIVYSLYQHTLYILSSYI